MRFKHIAFKNHLGLTLAAVMVFIAPLALATPSEDLFQAIERKNLSAVQKALGQKADPNGLDDNKVPALARAVQSGSLPVVKWLMEHGATLPADPETRDSLLSDTYFSANLPLIQYLFAKGLEPKPQDNDFHLHNALQEGRLDLMEYFLKLGMNPNSVPLEPEMFSLDYQGEELPSKPLLSHAITAGNLNAVKLLLRYKADPNLQANFGESPLMYAIAYKQYAIASWLLNLRPKLGLQDRNGDTVLHLAVKQNQPAIVSSLLAQGASPLTENNARITPLDLAFELSAGGKPALLNQLLARVPAADKAQALGHSLVMAAGRGETASVNLLLRLGAAPGFSLPDGSSALMHAARHGRLELVQLLLGKGLTAADVDLSGQTALFYAAEAGKLDVLRHLQSAGGQLTAVTEDGLNLLMQAARFKQPEIARYLREQGLPLEARDMHGRTALLWAVDPLGDEERQLELVSYLLAQKADTGVKDAQGQTVVHLALGSKVDAYTCCVSGRTVELFEKADFDVNALDPAGRSPLMLLTHSLDSKRMLEALLSRKARPNLQDKKGNTALHHLVMVSCLFEPRHGAQPFKYYYPREFWDAVKVLLKYGADPNIRNQAGKTPLDFEPDLLKPYQPES